jgi:hypothetical protein
MRPDWLPFPSLVLSLVLFALAGCSDAPHFDAPAREPGARTPLTAPCDGMDSLRCLLPWPSSTFSRADATSPTGIRLAVDAGSLTAKDDDPASINRSDGFSRLTPLVTGFAARLEPPSGTPQAGPVRLVLAQPDHPEYGESVPLRTVVQPSVDNEGESLVMSYPLRPLEPGADYVAVVMDDLRAEGGAKLAASRPALVALDRAEPESEKEAKLRAYHAPSRAVLAKAGIDPDRVIRIWDFTTRSAADATRRLLSMQQASRAAVGAGAVSVVIDLVELPVGGVISAIVEGRLTGLPSFVDAGGLSLDADGLPIAAATREAPFRVVVPAGMGDYRFVMFGHGMGGSFRDSAFDEDLAGGGVAKVGIQFHGWTEDDVIDTFVSLLQMFKGTEHSTALLMQALADGAAVQEAMASVLGDALSAPMLGGAANPAVGRRPDTTVPVWAGGSLGGTMGLVYASADPAIHAAILNVPGAGWSHFVPGSTAYATLQALLKGGFGGDLDLAHAVAMSQGNWDDIDGGAWIEKLRDKPSAFLLQESIGDPVLPNPGSEMVAVTADALQVGAVLEPITGLESAGEAVDRSGITQYRVGDTDALDIHGFAARNTPAGAAAREQIEAYLLSVYAGAPRITVPAGCVGGTCDFTN